jgi:uncharacterized protein
MLKEKIKDDFMQAYKAKDTLKAETLKMLKAAIQYKEIDLKSENKEITDQDVLAILKLEEKKHKESISQYISAGRKEAAEKEEQEMKVIQEYLPQMMSYDDVYTAVTSIFKKVEDSTSLSFGLMMKEAMSVLKDKADSSDIKKAVDEFVEETKNAKK